MGNSHTGDSRRHGNRVDHYNLGYDYYHGKGGYTQNYGMAEYWYRKSAEQGYAPAQNNLGFLYDKGHGVTQCDSTATDRLRYCVF